MFILTADDKGYESGDKREIVNRKDSWSSFANIGKLSAGLNSMSIYRSYLAYRDDSPTCRHDQSVDSLD